MGRHPEQDGAAGRRPRRLLTTAAVAAAVAVAMAAVWVPAASAEDGIAIPLPSDTRTALAQPEEAEIAPGVMTYTNGDAQCTANFVFTDGTDVFLGQAAHCAGTGGSTETDGCTSGSLPLGTPVEIEGAEQPGTLAYSSWIAMQENGETDPNLCQFNDFALVKLDPADAARTTPTMPFYGGPTAVAQEGTPPAGETVYGYSNSSLRQGVDALKPKTGTTQGPSGDGRTHTVLTVLPGIPGDSGSGYLTSDGEAFGVLSTLNIAPAAGSNGVSDLGSALEYANDEGGYGGALELVAGQKPFTPQPLPLDLGQG